LSRGEAVKIKEGAFESFEGTIEEIDEEHGKITVLIEIFGRSTPVELEYWEVEKV
jgi:transcriptional antiterminator NusG